MKNRKTKNFVARCEVAHQPPLKPLLAPSVEAKPQRLIVVLGMHRSGTSAITRGLQVMGVELGDRLMPPVESENPKGYWEDLDLNTLNIEMLSVLGSDWNHLSLIDLIDVEILRKKGYLLRALDLLHQKVGKVPIFGFKDPRVAKLLPFWKIVFIQCKFDVSYVIAVRHPLSVVKSLAKRGIESGQSYLLWLGHIITILTGCYGNKNVLIDFDSLMQNPDHELMRIAKLNNLKIDTIELQRYKFEFLDNSLRHTVYRTNDLMLDDTCPPIVREVYTTFIDIIHKEINLDNLELQTKIVRWSEELERLKFSMLLVDKLFIKNIIYMQIVTERDANMVAIEQHWSEKSRNQELEIVRRGEWGLSRDQVVTEREGQIAQLSQVVTEREGQIAQLSQVVTEREAKMVAIERSLSKKIREQDLEIVRRGEWGLSCNAELKKLQSEFNEVICSYSWKLTSPLRVWKWFWPTAISIFNSFPINRTSKDKIAFFLFKHFPSVFDHLDSYKSWKSRQEWLIKNTTRTILHTPVLVNDNLAPNSTGAVIRFEYFSQPVLVSVIIPIYGQINYTLRCLNSIAQNSPIVPFEVLIVDDCSPDNSVEVLARQQGIRLIKNSKNLGFIRSCNRGASEAKGQYLLFLNNDTEVTTGWLDELLRTFEEFPGTGLVGSKLIYPDGVLQEAGGIIWQDGSAWNFGRLQDPQLPIYNYAREVDYCSGASIMVPKVLFDEIGGFDEYYLPAYCEDADLALTIRNMGYRVIYQPLSTVIHYEGITSGVDTSQGIKAYQILNTKKLYVKWKSYLDLHQPNGTDIDNAKDRRAIRRVLVIDHCTPTPDHDSGSIDAYNIMLLLREMDFQVTFIPEDNFLYMPKYTTALQRVGIEMLYAPYCTSVEQHLKDFGDRYELSFLFRPAVAEKYIKSIRKLCKNVKILFHTVDLHFLRMKRELELYEDQSKIKNAEEMKQRELDLITAADITTVVSTEELILLSEYVKENKVRLLPYSRFVEGTNNFFHQRKDIIFVGGYQHTPNIDAVHYFVAEIMPLLRKSLPGVNFYVVGSKPPPEIHALANKDIIISGFVENLTPLLDKMRVSVAPLRYGAGIKGKIGTAMAVGLPVVATPLAAEGMSLTDEKNILVADGAEQFANSIIRIYQDEALWNKISYNGLEFAENAWGAETAWNTLSGILRELGINSERNTRALKLYRPF